MYRRCLDCPAITKAARCDACAKARRTAYNATPRHRATQAAYERTPARKAYKAKRYGGTWAADSKATRAAHVAQHGWTCPGYKRDPHPSADLVVDHDLGVLCRSCNAVKASTEDASKHRGPRLF